MNLSKDIRVIVVSLLVAFAPTLTSLRADENGSATQDNVPRGFQSGRRPDSLFSFGAVKLFGDDLDYIFTSPTRWGRDDWIESGILSASVVATTSLDHGIRVVAQRNRSAGLDRAAKDVQYLGAEYSFVILGAFEGWARIEDDPRANAVAIDGLTSSLIASGIIAPVLKYGVGRVRPTNTDRTFKFKPFSGSASFPSGHTTQAFAVASVIAADYSEAWVKVLAYGGASLVGVARIEQNAHFASDVVAGAIIGTLVGRTVAAHNNTSKRSAFNVTPLIDGTHVGLIFSRDF